MGIVKSLSCSGRQFHQSCQLVGTSHWCQVTGHPLHFSPSKRTQPLLVCQHYRGFDLTIRNGPVFSQQPVFFLYRDYLKPMFFIKTHCPNCIRPSADQQGVSGLILKKREELPSYPMILFGGANISVTNDCYPLDVLNTHHAYELTVLFISPKLNAIFDLISEVLLRHVGLFPTIIRDNSFVGRSRFIDHTFYPLKVIVITLSNHKLTCCSKSYAWRAGKATLKGRCSD